MKTKKLPQIILALTLAFGLLAIAISPSYAQSPVRAEVDRNQLPVGETLTLTITVSGSANSPQMPMLAGFQIVGNSHSSQISIVNGAISSQAVYSYVLQATTLGTYTIPEIPVVVNQQTYLTQPIYIEVTQGADPTASQQNSAPNPNTPNSEEFYGQDLYIEAEIDNLTPYVGEQITHTFRFYRAINLTGQPTYEASDFAGFWSEGESQQIDYDTTINNRPYHVTEITTILFPTSAGEHIIEPAALNIPGGIFTNGTQLKTNAVPVNVQALPAPAPDSFHGAVGQFIISTSLDKNQVAINEPITLNISLQGKGNFNTLPDPEMPVLNNWRTYESTATINSQIQDGIIQGSRITKQLMVPGSAGEFTIPPIAYTYFDPELNSYHTINSEPMTVYVSEGVAQNQTPQETAPAINSPIPIPANDIQHIKAVPEMLKTASTPLLKSWLYWGLWLLPVGLVTADFTWRRKQHFRAENPDLVRSSRAQKKAYKKLTQAQKNKEKPANVIGQILIAYLSERLNQPLSGLTQKELGTFLSTQGFSPSLIKQIKSILTFSEKERYAPTTTNSATPDEIYQLLRELIARTEKIIS